MHHHRHWHWHGVVGPIHIGIIAVIHVVVGGRGGHHGIVVGRGVHHVLGRHPSWFTNINTLQT